MAGIDQFIKEAGLEPAAFKFDAIQRRLATLADKSIRSSRIAKTRNVNPFLDWSAEVVEAVKRKPDRSEVVVTTEVRDIKRMHEHNRKDPTVASLKIIKENTDINDVQDNFREAIRQPDGLVKTDVLFSTTNFMLQSVGETDTEKFQILDNFGAPQIFMFGRRPRMYTYSGMLWNTKLNNWKDEFKYIWDRYLRGTKCVENGAKMLLTYDRSVRVGYLVNVNINQSSETDMAVPINFTMFIESEKENLDLDIIDPTRNATNLGDFEESAFRLVNEQRTDTNENARVLNEAINRKITINETQQPIGGGGNVDDKRDKNVVELSNLLSKALDKSGVNDITNITYDPNAQTYTNEVTGEVSLSQKGINDGKISNIKYDVGAQKLKQVTTGRLTTADDAEAQKTINKLRNTIKSIDSMKDLNEIEKQQGRAKLNDLLAETLALYPKLK